MQSGCTEAHESKEEREDSVTAVVKELPERTTGARSPSLFPVDSIQGLVDEYTYGT